MGRRHNKSILEELLSQLWDLTDCIWQFGAGVSVFFGFLSIKSFLWVQAIEQDFTGKPMAAMFEQFSWIFYLLPIICLLVSIFVGKRAYVAFHEQRNI